MSGSRFDNDWRSSGPPSSFHENRKGSSKGGAKGDPDYNRNLGHSGMGGADSAYQERNPDPRGFRSMAAAAPSTWKPGLGLPPPGNNTNNNNTNSSSAGRGGGGSGGPAGFGASSANWHSNGCGTNGPVGRSDEGSWRRPAADLPSSFGGSNNDMRGGNNGFGSHDSWSKPDPWGPSFDRGGKDDFKGSNNKGVTKGDFGKPSKGEDRWGGDFSQGKNASKGFGDYDDKGGKGKTKGGYPDDGKGKFGSSKGFQDNFDDDFKGRKGKSGKPDDMFDDFKGGKGKKGRMDDFEDDYKGGKGKKGKVDDFDDYKGGKGKRSRVDDYDDDFKGGKNRRIQDGDDFIKGGKGKPGKFDDYDDSFKGGKGNHSSFGDDLKGGKGKTGKFDDFGDSFKGGKGKIGKHDDFGNDSKSGKGKSSRLDSFEDPKGGKGKTIRVDTFDEFAGGKGKRGKPDEDDSKGGKGKHDDRSKGKGNHKGKDHDEGGKPSGKDRSSKGEKGEECPTKGKGKGGKKGKHSAAVSDSESEDGVTGPTPARKSGGTGAVSGKHLSDRKFGDLNISKNSKRALAEGFGYELMTQVQASTVDPLLAGHDVVARAKTGTGKTLAFLVPTVELISKYPSGVGGSIGAIVLSPTRELAAQISDEAQTLLRFHPKLGAVCVYGGTNIKSDHSSFKNKPVDILVATPGRLQDHLDNTAGFRDRCGYLSFLCLDEADQLLDMGFRDAIMKILKCLPPASKRQGALFSATFPAAVQEISKLALKSSHDWIDTVDPSDEVTPDQISQSVCITNMEGMTELLWKAVNFEIRRLPKDHKIMVFFTTARLTQLYSELFNQAKVPVQEVHSRKSQAHRTKCAQTFRESRTGIIFSSDVSARGLDYPDVTAVIQVGIPSARDQYIHRLGRTGRAGKSGRCILLLHDFEEFFLKTVADLPVQRWDAETTFTGVPAPPDSLWVPWQENTAGQAYQAWLGYYNSVKGLRWSKEQLVEQANYFAETIGALDEQGYPPALKKKTVGMMGLKGVRGLNIVG